MADHDNDGTGERMLPAVNERTTTQESNPALEQRGFIRFYTRAVRDLLRSRRSILMDIYAQILKKPDDGSPPVCGTLDDARNHVLGMQVPGFMMDDLLRLERAKVAWHRIHALWMLFWTLLAPLATTLYAVMDTFAFRHACASGDILEFMFLSMFAFILFCVLALLSLIPVKLLTAPFLKYLVAPILGMDFVSFSTSGTNETTDSADTSKTDDRGRQ